MTRDKFNNIVSQSKKDLDDDDTASEQHKPFFGYE